MNSAQQRERHTQIGDLEKKTDALAEALDLELTERMTEIREAVSDERTHRFKLAAETQSCIDAANRGIAGLGSCVEALAQVIAAVTTLTLWGRIRWILTGRCK